MKQKEIALRHFYQSNHLFDFYYFLFIKIKIENQNILTNQTYKMCIYLSIMNTPWGPSTATQLTKPVQYVTFPVDPPKGSKASIEKEKIETLQKKQQHYEERQKQKGLVSITTCSRELSIQIQQARCAMQPNVTQKDLDKKCNFPPNTVRDYENGSANVIPKQLTVLSQVLGVQLKRPTKADKKFEPV